MLNKKIVTVYPIIFITPPLVYCVLPRATQRSRHLGTQHWAQQTETLAVLGPGPGGGLRSEDHPAPSQCLTHRRHPLTTDRLVDWQLREVIHEWVKESVSQFFPDHFICHGHSRFSTPVQHTYKPSPWSVVYPSFWLLPSLGLSALPTLRDPGRSPSIPGSPEGEHQTKEDHSQNLKLHKVC